MKKLMKLLIAVCMTIAMAVPAMAETTIGDVTYGFDGISENTIAAESQAVSAPYYVNSYYYDGSVTATPVKGGVKVSWNVTNKSGDNNWNICGISVQSSAAETLYYFNPAGEATSDGSNFFVSASAKGTKTVSLPTSKLGNQYIYYVKIITYKDLMSMTGTSVNLTSWGTAYAKSIPKVPTKAEFGLRTFSSMKGSFAADVIKDGIQIEIRNVNTNKVVKKLNDYDSFTFKKNIPYKFRVRAYVKDYNDKKYYSGWSPYRYLEVPTASSKHYYNESGYYVTLKGAKGCEKFRVQTSNQREKGYKLNSLVTVGAGKTKTFKFTKYGNKTIAAKSGTYYSRVTPKIKGKYYSDVYTMFTIFK